MEDQESVTCKLICEEDSVSGKNSAYLAMFSSGFLTEGASNIKFQSYENSHTPDGLQRKRTRKILVADSGKLQYTGCNYGTQASQRGELNRYFVGVRNKKTGKMTVHEVQLVHCTPLLNITSHKDDEDDYKTKTFTEKMDLLTDAFGSKRKRRAMESRISYASGNNADGSNVADSIDVADLRKNNLAGSDTADPLISRIIPPRNASAATPDKVYDVKDVMSQEEYYAIESLAKELTEATSGQIKQWRAKSVYGELVLKNLQKPSSVDINTAKLLVYYNYLIQVLKLVARDVKKKDPIPNIPEPFKGKLLERFTLSSTNEHGVLMRTMPLSLKDKAMIYAMILALFIEDFRVELPVLQLDFKKGYPTLVKIANALGCHVLSQKKNGVSIKVAELRLPLYVATPKTFGRKR